jgi:hypothetical protein
MFLGIGTIKNSTGEIIAKANATGYSRHDAYCKALVMVEKAGQCLRSEGDVITVNTTEKPGASTPS